MFQYYKHVVMSVEKLIQKVKILILASTKLKTIFEILKTFR